MNAAEWALLGTGERPLRELLRLLKQKKLRGKELERMKLLENAIQHLEALRVVG